MIWLSLEPLGNVLILAGLHVAEAHCTFAVVRPERALLPQVDFVEAEEVFDEQTLKPRKDLHVIEVIDGVDSAAAVVDGSL